MKTLREITEEKIKDTLLNSGVVIDSALSLYRESFDIRLDELIIYIDKNKKNLDCGRLICKIRTLKKDITE
jgi:hypothetical protein